MPCLAHSLTAHSFDMFCCSRNIWIFHASPNDVWKREIHILILSTCVVWTKLRYYTVGKSCDVMWWANKPQNEFIRQQTSSIFSDVRPGKWHIPERNVHPIGATRHTIPHQKAVQTLSRFASRANNILFMQCEREVYRMEHGWANGWQMCRCSTIATTTNSVFSPPDYAN